MSLFDKLSKMTPAPSPAPAPAPAPSPAPAPAMFAKTAPAPEPPAPAADLHSPHDPLARGPGSPKPLMDKLRAVGAVNPPAPARAPAPLPATPEPVAAPEPIPETTGNTCPHCRQTFKVLARHRCKGAPASAPAPEPVAPAGPRRTICAFCGEKIDGIDPAHFAVCKGAPAPAPARSEPEPSFHGFGPEPVADPAPGPAPAPVAEPGPAPEPVAAPAPSPGPFTRAADDVLRRTPAPEPATPTKSARHIEDLTAGNVTERSALDGYVLFLDVLFEKNEFDANGMKHFSDIVHPLAEQVARENKTAHWGTVEYNRGGSLLAAKLEGWIKHVNPMGVILADGSTPECRACKEVLKRYAKVVIQGVR